MHSMKCLVSLFSVAVLLGGSDAAAQYTIEQSTSKVTQAAGNLVKCELGAKAKDAKSPDSEKLQESLGKCDTKFDSTVVKTTTKSPPADADDIASIANGLRATTQAANVRATAVADAKARYTDNLDGTVTDHATGLQWEQDANPGTFTLGSVIPPYLSDGTAFTTFLPDLNGGLGDCFAGYCDWRLPTADELKTLLLAAPCAPSCIDTVVFGAPAGAVWTGTSDQDAIKHLLVDFSTGTVTNDARNVAHSVRAVRQAAVKIPQSPNCGDTNKCIFATSKVSTANLGGLAGADVICNTLAGNAGLAGTYVAWLSDDATDAVTRVTSDGPYHTRSGDLVASSKADLTDGTLSTPIDEDEYGPIPLREAYTNSDAAGLGTGVGFSCANWTDGSGVPITPVGVTNATNSTWTYIFDQFCNRNNSIYCIQQ